MDYQTATENFEAMVTKMQDELAKYAARSNAQESVINYRVEQINKLVDLYNSFQSLVSEMEMQIMELNVGYNKLHRDVQKLVTFAELHNINPNMIFHYEQADLAKMLNAGTRIIPPALGLPEALQLNPDPKDVKALENEISELTQQYHAIAFRVAAAQLPHKPSNQTA
jgi:hypothetical protein